MKKPLLRAVITASLILAVGTCALVLRALTAAGVFTEVDVGFNGNCQAIQGIDGPADIQIDQIDSLAFVAATNRRSIHPSLQDGIYTVGVTHVWAGFARLGGAPRDFHPQSISLYRDANANLTLMATNHQATGTWAIDIFDVAVSNGKAMLRPRGHIESGLLNSPGDLVAIGPNEFYVANDHGSSTSIGRMIEDYLLVPWGNVLYFNGQLFRIAIDGLIEPSGLAISRDGTHLYVAEKMGRTLYSYRRDAFAGTLSEDGALAIPTAANSITVATDGSLWVAGQPNLFAALSYQTDASKPSPSQVFRIDAPNGVPRKAAAIYVNGGAGIGGASVAASLGSSLFIGSALDSKMLYCTMASSSQLD